MFMLSLKQKAALQVAQVAGMALLCGACASFAMLYLPTQVLLIGVMIVVVGWAMFSLYEIFLMRLKASEQINEYLNKQESK